MIKPGYIRIGIDRKVYFEYYKLPKLSELEYLKNCKGYKASKQLIKVINVFWHKGLKEWLLMVNYKIIKNNAPCKAEVTGDKATSLDILADSIL